MKGLIFTVSALLGAAMLLSGCAKPPPPRPYVVSEYYAEADPVYWYRCGKKPRGTPKCMRLNQKLSDGQIIPTRTYKWVYGRK